MTEYIKKLITVSGSLFCRTMLMRYCVSIWAVVSLVDSYDTKHFFHHDLNVISDKSPQFREGCGYGEAPAGRVDISYRLQKLRELMTARNVSAYIITSNDEHLSEYTAEHDKRRDYISGFTGSAGTAVVTLYKAAVWTDSRYFLQAEKELDCNWILMRAGNKDVPTIRAFLVNELKPGETVAADPKLVAFKDWLDWKAHFENAGIQMSAELENLVDVIWNEDTARPTYPVFPLFILDVSFTGKTWQTKLTEIRERMKEKSAEVLVLSALDEVAWTLNLRGGDVPYTPVFRAYLMIGSDWAILYLPADKVTAEIQQHLNSNAEYRADSVQIRDYNAIWSDLGQVNPGSSKIWLPGPFSYVGGASYLLYKTVPEDKVMVETSPALLMKDYKTPNEIAGMRNAHIRDAVALCQMMSKLEEEVTSAPGQWDEMKVSSYLDELRKQQELNMGPSFTTISAFGPNSALPHYSPKPDSNRIIDGSSLFMLDSGGQYPDGTTDVTRTMHYGVPEERQRTIYTHLLMGCIDLVSAVFPRGQTQPNLEILIRRPLYSLGLNYGHGSTHGIGSCLGVHEAFNKTYHEGFFGSQEPGYYEAGTYGMRLENIVTVIEADVQTRDGSAYLTFDTVTLVPYEAKLINTEYMSIQQILWLNKYHQQVLEIVGQEMLRQGLNNTYEWLVRKTQPIS